MIYLLTILVYILSMYIIYLLRDSEHHYEYYDFMSDFEY